MENREIKVDYECYFNAVPPEYAALCERASEMVKNAYCIYSGFAVGAAVLLANGEMVGGCNQENVAYPSGLCAERTALFSAGAMFPHEPIVALALVASKGGEFTGSYISPCGACRQVMAEVVKRTGDFDVVMVGRRESVCIKASKLLPFAFDF